MADSSATVSSSPSSSASRRTRVASARTLRWLDHASRSIYIFPSRYSDALSRAVARRSRPGASIPPGLQARMGGLCSQPRTVAAPQEQRVDFSYTEEQLMIQDVARRIAQEKIAPSAEHHDRTGEFPLDNIRLLGENGLMGIEVPAEYGGADMDPVAYVLAMVEVAAADAAHSTIMSVNNSLFCNGILTHGTEAQKQKYVRAIAEGEEIGAFALTEPQSGSDATAMRCRAVKQADGSYVVNGKKSWITSGPVAKYIVLFAMTDPDKGAKGITAFIIDTTREGFGRGKTEPKLGIRASATCEIEFDDYVVEPEEVLGEEGQGFRIAMGVLDAGRIGIASQAIGIARAAYEA